MNEPWTITNRVMDEQALAANVVARIADHIHPDLGPASVAVTFDNISNDGEVIIYHAHIAFAKPLWYGDLTHLGTLMADMCHTSTREDMMGDAFKFKYGPDTFHIGDGDDGAAAWLTGGVIVVWVRAWRNETDV